MELTRDYVKGLEARIESLQYTVGAMQNDADMARDVDLRVSDSYYRELADKEERLAAFEAELGNIWQRRPELVSAEWAEAFEEEEQEWEAMQKAGFYYDENEELCRRTEPRDMNIVRPGDVIKARGIVAMIDRILYQEHHEERKYEFPSL